MINVYQHAWEQRADTTELKRKQRARILEKAEDCLRQVPWRNLCVCAGDWNVQLEPMSDHVGHTTVLLPGQRQSAQDAEALIDVMIAQQLVAVNGQGHVVVLTRSSTNGIVLRSTMSLLDAIKLLSSCASAAFWVTSRLPRGGFRGFTGRCNCSWIIAGNHAVGMPLDVV